MTVPADEIGLGRDAQELLAAAAVVVGVRPPQEYVDVDGARAVVRSVVIDVDGVDDVLQRLELRVEVGIAVVERVIDDDRRHARARAARVEGAVATRAHRELADAVHGPVGVARCPVGAADVTRMVGRGVRNGPEDEKAVVPCRAATADDDGGGGGRARRRGLRVRGRREKEPSGEEQRAGRSQHGGDAVLRPGPSSGSS
jgi:hypothetical protein